MVKSKSTKKNVSNTSVETKKIKPVLDLSSKGMPAQNSFTIHSLSADEVKVEPLLENEDNFFQDKEEGVELNVEVEKDLKPEIQKKEESLRDGTILSPNINRFENTRERAKSTFAPLFKNDPIKREFLPDNIQNIEAKDIIKVNFPTFVQLVINHDLEKIMDENAHQEIIMSTNLLTQLASARDQREDKKIPVILLVGIAIGVVLTYIFFHPGT